MLGSYSKYRFHRNAPSSVSTLLVCPLNVFEINLGGVVNTINFSCLRRCVSAATTGSPDNAVS